jgi:1-deoxy-D-xylulose-5-phosphate reductoisomerase
MRIPIFNSLFDEQTNKIKTEQLNIKKLNFLNFQKVDTKKFPSIKLIKKLKNEESLLETIIVLANDELVKLFLLKKLNFTDINIFLQRLINMKDIINLSKKKPSNIESITFIKELIMKKINKLIN